MKKILTIAGVIIGVLVVLALMVGCDRYPYDDPEVLVAREDTRQTEIRETAHTERVEIRESERTDQEQARADRAEQTRLLEVARMDHNKEMFQLWSLAVIASGYDNMVWIVVGGVVGGIAGYAVADRRKPQPKKKKKTDKAKLRKAAHEALMGILTEFAFPPYF